MFHFLSNKHLQEDKGLQYKKRGALDRLHQVNHKLLQIQHFGTGRFQDSTHHEYQLHRMAHCHRQCQRPEKFHQEVRNLLAKFPYNHHLHHYLERLVSSRLLVVHMDLRHRMSPHPDKSHQMLHKLPGVSFHNRLY